MKLNWNFRRGEEFKLSNPPCAGSGPGGGGGGTPYNGLYREALPKGLPFTGFRYIKG